MLRCRFISNPHDLKAVSQAWDSLVKESEFNDIFATSGFAAAWWRAYGESRILRVLTIEDECSVPRLIAPFYSDRSSPDVWRLIGSFRADYNNIIHKRGDLESLNALFSELTKRSDWRILELNRLPEQTSILDFFPAAYGPAASRDQKLRSWLSLSSPLVYRKLHQENPRIERAALNRYRDMLDQPRYRGYLNWLGRRGTLAYRYVDKADECLSILPQFIELHIRSWNAKGQDSFFLKSENRHFYQYLIEELATYGAMGFDIFSVNDKIIAAHFGFTWDHRIYYYKPCYDPDYSSRSPGKLLLSYIIRRGLESKVTEVDLLNGLEPYKFKFASGIRNTGSLRIYRSRLSAILDRSRGRNN
jgi:CelD/BcsL family acetyltransferase involved in cellulose biosynthesis